MKYKTTLAVLAFLALAANAHAQSPREQLKQMVGQLQKSPSDSALREKIIRLALTLKPSPALPDEAERRMVRGGAAFNGATSAADYQAAAKEFEQATLAAPWYGEAYYNLGVAQDKAEDYDAALRSLKLAALASPGSKDAEKLSYAVEFRKEKALSGPDFSGCWQDSVSAGMKRCYFLFERNGDGWMVKELSGMPLKIVKAQGRQLWIENDGGRGTTHYDLVLSEDGPEIECAYYFSQTAEQVDKMRREMGVVPNSETYKVSHFKLTRK